MGPIGPYRAPYRALYRAIFWDLFSLCGLSNFPFVGPCDAQAKTAALRVGQKGPRFRYANPKIGPKIGCSPQRENKPKLEPHIGPYGPYTEGTISPKPKFPRVWGNFREDSGNLRAQINQDFFKHAPTPNKSANHNILLLFSTRRTPSTTVRLCVCSCFCSFVQVLIPNSTLPKSNHQGKLLFVSQKPKKVHRPQCDCFGPKRGGCLPPPPLGRTVFGRALGPYSFGEAHRPSCFEAHGR